MSRSVLITGASRGIGAAIRERFASDGWSIIAPTRLELDLASPESLASFVNAQKATRIDAIVNNAGENTLGTIEKLPTSDLRRMLETNLIGPWGLVAAFAPQMRIRKWGRIVNVSSVYGILSRAGRGAYNASKSAMVGFTKTAAIEYGGDGILVNSVAPGFVETSMTRANNSPEDIARLCDSIPLGRLAHPSEIAALVFWLASEENSYVTGQTIPIDGGFLAG